MKVTRERAWRIAQAHLGNTRGVTMVRSLAELQELGEREPVIYGMPLEGVWIAYAGSVIPHAISSSYVVLVSMATGEVVYEGGAGDEG